MRPTPASRALFRATAPSHFGRTAPAACSSLSKANHYFIAYLRLHDHDLTHVSPAGTPDPRQKYWWRRLYTLMVGSQPRFWYKDNIFPEEQAIVFKHPVPGGHGDRFTHHWAPMPGANWKARQALQDWEVDNLTPEQLAAKYGLYIPRLQVEDLFMGFMVMFIWWLYLLIATYYDDELGFVTHPVLDDFIRELGGIQPLAPEEVYLEQWFHPYSHTQIIRKCEGHWSWKPIAMSDTKTFTPSVH